MVAPGGGELVWLSRAVGAACPGGQAWEQTGSGWFFLSHRVCASTRRRQFPVAGGMRSAVRLLSAWTPPERSAGGDGSSPRRSSDARVVSSMLLFSQLPITFES